MTITVSSCTMPKESQRRIVPKSLIERVSSWPEGQRSSSAIGALSSRSKKFMRMDISMVEVGSTSSQRRQYAKDACAMARTSTRPPAAQMALSVALCER